MKKITFIRRLLWMLPVSFLTCSILSCAEEELIDEDELEDAINPPLTWVDDDDGQTPDNEVSEYPAFPFFDNTGNTVSPGDMIAFPGAEGFGRNALGARGVDENAREVYKVTNLNDSGEGSLRDAVSKSGRIVVFDVAGVINLEKDAIALQPNQTILGQIAPGDGVVLHQSRVSATKASNTIVRYLRVRMGNKHYGEGSSDAVAIGAGSNIIFDHCSVSWGRDENFSVTWDGKASERPQNITISNCIIGQGLHNHSCGGLMQTDSDKGVTIYGCLYIDNKTRNPKVKGLNQFVNNVVYNWGNGAAYDMADSGAESNTAVENCYFIVGACKEWKTTDDGWVSYNPTKPITGANENVQSYVNGNYYDSNKNGLLDGHELGRDDISGTPNFLPEAPSSHPRILNKMTALNAYNHVVKSAGAVLPARDEVDTYLIDELTSLGKKGAIISRYTNTDQFSLGGCGTIKTGDSPVDTDNDGIPDEFEDKWGLDKNNPKDAVRTAENGFMNIENYALSLEFPTEYEKAYQEWLEQKGE